MSYEKPTVKDYVPKPTDGNLGPFQDLTAAGKELGGPDEFVGEVYDKGYNDGRSDGRQQGQVETALIIAGAQIGAIALISGVNVVRQRWRLRAEQRVQKELEEHKKGIEAPPRDVQDFLDVDVRMKCPGFSSDRF